MGSRKAKKSKNEAKRSRRTARPLLLEFSHMHLILLFAMMMIYIFGSYFLPTIDTDTLKPGPGFPSWLKVLSYYSNIPIKVGFVHMFLYGIELYRYPEIFPRHVGQRLSTLWIQFFEDPRWGQHLHMQTETLLQIVDIHNQRDVKYSFGKMELNLLKVFGVLMMFTNFITSTAYHTFEEQTIGFVITVAKLGFDYSAIGADVNSYIGSTLGTAYTLGCGILLYSLCYISANYALDGDKGEFLSGIIGHPTVIASTLFVGGSIGRVIENSLK